MQGYKDLADYPTVKDNGDGLEQKV